MYQENRIAVVIPALNEEKSIGDVIAAIPAFVDTIVVVDDGSSDATAAIAAKTRAKVVSHQCNMGVGRAFQTGLIEGLKSGADIIANIDADGQFNPADIPTLIDPIVVGRADFTTASRFKNPDLIPEMPAVKKWGNRMMSHLISKIAGRKFHDVSCGFRAYNREAALQLNLWGDFTYTQESILDLVVKGMRIEEVPLRIRGTRQHGSSKMASNLFRYGFRAAKIILHTYRDFWPIHFFGWLSMLCFVPGTGLILFLFVHRLIAGSFTPHIWAGFTGGGLFVFGLFLLTVGLLGEMLKRIRMNQELLLYYQRRLMHGKQSDDRPNTSAQATGDS